MPEGPEIAQWTTDLRGAGLGNVFNNINIDNVIYYMSEPQCHGKWLYLPLRETKKKGPKKFYLSFHFGTHGHPVLNPVAPQYTKKTFPISATNKEAQARIEPNIAYALHFVDKRGFGKWAFLTEEAFAKEMASYGPDPLKLTLNEFHKAAAPIYEAHKKSRKKLAILLLEQSFFAGVGNYLRAEILYRADVQALITFVGIGPSEWKRIVDATWYAMRSTEPPVIYQKKIAPDGHPIIHSTLNGRTLWSVCGKTI